MTDPLVSIVIPTYDRVGYLEVAIRSVLDQDYERLELIVVDDGSHDETPALLARIADGADPARFRWIRQENAGQAAAINRGLAQAGGELLGYLSSDDYLLPGAIARLVDGARAHPDAEVIYPSFQIGDEADRIFDTAELVQHTFVDAVRWSVCIPGVGVLVRRSLYERIGGWDPSYRFCPDYEWWLRARDARFLRIPEPLGVWRSHDGSTSMSLTMETVHERLRLLDAVYAADDLPQELLDVRDEAYAAMLVTCGTLLGHGIVGGPDGRFTITDALTPAFSRRTGAVARSTLERLQRDVHSLGRDLRVATATIEQCDATNAVLRAALDEQGARLADSEARCAAAGAALDRARERLAAAERAAARPPWLRAARALTPPRLRPRVGAALHRLRRGA